MAIKRFSQDVESVKREARQRVRELQDREGYLKNPQSPAEAQLWEAEAAWPEE